MNRLIETIFANFTVNGVAIPVKFLRYEGHGEPYVIYQHTDADASISADNELLGYVDFYDFDIYSKENYMPIIEGILQIMKDNNFTYQPSRSSADMYETDTGYYHRTLCFAIERMDIYGENRTEELQVWGSV